MPRRRSYSVAAVLLVLCGIAVAVSLVVESSASRSSKQASLAVGGGAQHSQQVRVSPWNDFLKRQWQKQRQGHITSRMRAQRHRTSSARFSRRRVLSAHMNNCVFTWHPILPPLMHTAVFGCMFAFAHLHTRVPYQSSLLACQSVTGLAACVCFPNKPA
jgi:hypothetical protein